MLLLLRLLLLNITLVVVAIAVKKEERNEVCYKGIKKEKTPLFEDSIILNRNPTNSQVRKFTELNIRTVAKKQGFLYSSVAGASGC